MLVGLGVEISASIFPALPFTPGLRLRFSFFMEIAAGRTLRIKRYFVGHAGGHLGFP